MPAAQPPVRSTQQLDLLRRLRTRDGQHGEFGMPFLDDEERDRIDRLLEASVEQGVTAKVQRRSHALLVAISARDETVRFLDDGERRQLAALTRTEPEPAPKTSLKRKKNKRKAKSTGMTPGEALASIGVILSVAVAAYLTYENPGTTRSTIWVGVWGVVLGGSFIGDARRRSNKTGEGKISATEGFLAMVIWAIASVSVVLLGGHVVSVGWAAFLSFIGAGIIGRAVLKIEDEKPKKGDDDWDDWDDD